MEENDVSGFEFNPLDVETSSQIGGDDLLDRTADICSEYLRNAKPNYSKVYDVLDTTVEQILLARGKPDPVEANLINLEETMTADQDHNYLINEDNDNIDDDENPLNAEVLSLRSDLREKENQIIQLVEENSKLKEEGKTKDELNDALTASNNSLEDVLDARHWRGTEIDELHRSADAS